MASRNLQEPQLTRTTPRDRRQHTLVLGRHPLGVLAKVTIRMLSQGICDGRHASYLGLRLPEFDSPEFGLSTFGLAAGLALCA